MDPDYRPDEIKQLALRGQGPLECYGVIVPDSSQQTSGAIAATELPWARISSGRLG